MSEQSRLRIRHGIRDTYHQLVIGPCEMDIIRKETNCRLVAEAVAIGDEFDCSHAEWAEHFRGDVLEAAALGWPGKADPIVLLSEREKLEVAGRPPKPLRLIGYPELSTGPGRIAAKLPCGG
jgi:hypothetical protein